MASAPDAALSRRRALGCCANCSSRSPFFIAVEEGDTVEVARFLREDALWIKQVDKGDRRTAWHLAAENGHIEVLRQLVERAREEETGTLWNAHRTLRARLMSRSRETPGPDERVLELVNGRTRWGSSPLALAAAADQAETVRYLLTLGADLWQADYEGLNPAHFAAKSGAIRALQVLLEEERPMSGRADSNGHPGARYVDSLDSFGFTPLHYATWCNRRSAMMVLVGFDANLITRSLLFHSQYFNLPAGSTPLHIACLMGCLDRVKLLLRAYYETAADLLPSQTAMLGTTERRRRARSHPDPRLILNRTQRLPFHVAARCGNQHLLDWLDPSVPLMFLFGGEEASDEAEGGRGSGTGPLVGVSRLTVIAAKALHQALLASLDTAAEDIRRHQESVEARRRRREERRVQKEAEAAAQCLKQGKEPPPEGLRGKLRWLIERTPKSATDGNAESNAATVRHGGTGGEGTGWPPWRSRGRWKRGRKTTTSGAGDRPGGEERSGAAHSPRRRGRGATAGATAATAGRLGSRSGATAVTLTARPETGLTGSQVDSDWSTDTDASGGAMLASDHVSGLPGGPSAGGGGGGGCRPPSRLPPLPPSEPPPPSASSSLRNRLLRDAVGAAAPPQPPPTQRRPSFTSNGIAVVSDNAGAGGISATEPGGANGTGGTAGGQAAGGSDSGAASSRARSMLQRLYRGPVWRRGSGQAEAETSREHAQLIGRLDRVGITIPEGPNVAVAYFSPGREPRYNIPTQIVIPSAAPRAPGQPTSPTFAGTTAISIAPAEGPTTPGDMQLTSAAAAAAEPSPSRSTSAAQNSLTNNPESTNSTPQVPAGTPPAACDADRPSAGSDPPAPSENDRSIGAGTGATGRTPRAPGSDVTCASGGGRISGKSTPRSATELLLRKSTDRNLPSHKIPAGSAPTATNSSPRPAAEATAAIVVVSGDAAAAPRAPHDASTSTSTPAEAATRGASSPAGQKLAVVDVAGAPTISVPDSSSPPASCSLPFISQHLPLSPIRSLGSKDPPAAAILLGPTSPPLDSSRCTERNASTPVVYNGSVELPGAPSASKSMVPSVLVPALSAPSVLSAGDPHNEAATSNGNGVGIGTGAPRSVPVEDGGQLVDTLPLLTDQAADQANAGGGTGAGDVDGGDGNSGGVGHASGAVVLGRSQSSGSHGTSRLSRVGASALSLLDSLRSTLRRTGAQRQGQVLPMADNQRARTNSAGRSAHRRRNLRLSDSAAAPSTQSDAAAPSTEQLSPSNSHAHPHAAHRGVRVSSGRPRFAALGRSSIGAGADSPAPSTDATDGGAATAGGSEGVRSHTSPSGRRSRASQARRSLISVARRLTGRSARHDEGSVTAGRQQSGRPRSQANEGASASSDVTSGQGGQQSEGADGEQQQQEHAGSDNSEESARKEGRNTIRVVAAEGGDEEQEQGLRTAATRCGSSSSLGSDASMTTCDGTDEATGGGGNGVTRGALAAAEEEEDICPVCLDEAPNLVVQTCRHPICMECARDLVKRHGLTPALCPYCRGIISSFKAHVALDNRRR